MAPTWILGGHTGRSGDTRAVTESLAQIGLAGARYLVWLDGVKQQSLDLYSATTHKKLMAWSPATSLSAGSHTLEIRVLGTRDSHATATRVDLYALLVWS